MGGDLDIAVDRDGDRALLRVTGPCDAYTGDLLRAAIAGEVEQGATQLDVDASRITFVDSAGLRVLTDANDDLASRGGRLAIIDASETVARLLRITDLSGRFGL